MFAWDGMYVLVVLELREWRTEGSRDPAQLCYQVHFPEAELGSHLDVEITNNMMDILYQEGGRVKIFAFVQRDKVVTGICSWFGDEDVQVKHK